MLETTNLETRIANHLAVTKLGDPTWERTWADLLVEKHSKARMPTVAELARAFRYIENEFRITDGKIHCDMWAEGLAFGRYAGDASDVHQAKAALSQLSTAEWLRITECANRLSISQYETARYIK